MVGYGMVDSLTYYHYYFILCMCIWNSYREKIKERNEQRCKIRHMYYYFLINYYLFISSKLINNNF